jgi:hypothetical protein
MSYLGGQVGEVGDFPSPLNPIPSRAHVIGLDWLRVKDQRKDMGKQDRKPPTSPTSPTGTGVKDWRQGGKERKAQRLALPRFPQNATRHRQATLAKISRKFQQFAGAC